MTNGLTSRFKLIKQKYINMTNDQFQSDEHGGGEGYSPLRDAVAATPSGEGLDPSTSRPDAPPAAGKKALTSRATKRTRAATPPAADPLPQDKDEDLSQWTNMGTSNIAEIAPSLSSQTKLSVPEVKAILSRLGNMVGLTPNRAFAAVALLFLKGAASTGAPSTMSVDVADPDGTDVTVTKDDLLFCYKAITKNGFLRRLAETLSVEISQFAQDFGLSGELSAKIEARLLSENKEALSATERAWCSSFCQNIVDLNKRAKSERLAALLSRDYLERFQKAKGGGSKSSGSQSGKSKEKPKEPKGPNSGSGGQGSGPKAGKKSKGKGGQ